MEAKELRIGNLVYEISDTPESPTTETIIEIAAINSIYKTGCDDDDNIYSLSVFEPIPLTEEWLLKFGFEENKRVNKIIVKSFSKNISFIGTYKTLSVSVEVGNTYIYIREGDELIDRSKDDIICLFNSDYRGKLYVHQLQNLYFALTGEELTLKNN